MMLEAWNNITVTVAQFDNTCYFSLITNEIPQQFPDLLNSRTLPDSPRQ